MHFQGTPPGGMRKLPQSVLQPPYSLLADIGISLVTEKDRQAINNDVRMFQKRILGLYNTIDNLKSDLDAEKAKAAKSTDSIKRAHSKAK